MSEHFSYDPDYLETLPKLIMCSICNYPFEYPVTCYVCEYTMCRDCVSDPVHIHRCGDINISTQYSINGNPTYSKFLSELQVVCAVNSSNGCNWTGTRATYDSHKDECANNFHKCLFCDKYINNKTDIDHNGTCDKYREWNDKIVACTKNKLMIQSEDHSEIINKLSETNTQLVHKVNDCELTIGGLSETDSQLVRKIGKLNDTNKLLAHEIDELKIDIKKLHVSNIADTITLTIDKPIDIKKICTDYIAEWGTTDISTSVILSSAKLPEGVWEIINCVHFFSTIGEQKQLYNHNNIDNDRFNVECSKFGLQVRDKYNRDTNKNIQIVANLSRYNDLSIQQINKLKNGKYNVLHLMDYSGAPVFTKTNCNSHCVSYNEKNSHPFYKPIPKLPQIVNNAESYYDEISIELFLSKIYSQKIMADNTGKYIIPANIFANTKIIAKRIA